MRVDDEAGNEPGNYCTPRYGLLVNSNQEVRRCAGSSGGQHLPGLTRAHESMADTALKMEADSPFSCQYSLDPYFPARQ
jgi:hypothetical protein